MQDKFAVVGDKEEEDVGRIRAEGAVSCSASNHSRNYEEAGTARQRQSTRDRTPSSRTRHMSANDNLIKTRDLWMLKQHSQPSAATR